MTRAQPSVTRSSPAARPAARPGDLDVRIDELVLHGVAPSDRHAVAGAVEQELARLLRDDFLRGGATPPGWLDGVVTTGGLALPRLDAGAFDVPADATPRAVGLELARALHRGFAAGPTGPRRVEVR